MLEILEPSDHSLWKVGLSRKGLVSFYRKVSLSFSYFDSTYPLTVYSPSHCLN